MIQSYFILEDRGHRITLGQMPRDDTIPLHSRGPRSPNHFRESAQGWYIPVTFSRTEVTGSIMDRCPGMIQSLFILEDRGHRITFGQMSRDDTIHLHSQGLRPSYHFRVGCQGWYDPTTTSLLPLSGKVLPNHTKLVSKVFELYPRQRLCQHIII